MNGSSDQDTGLRILDVAEEILERVGEPNLRVADVAEKCGIAIGLIYHYYRDRSALVAAVRLRQYTRNVEADIESMSALQQSGANPADVYAVTQETIGNLPSEARRKARRERIAVLSATQHNEVLREAVRASQQQLNDRIVAVVTHYQEIGFVDRSIDPKAVALFLEALPLGLAILDANPDAAPDQDAWDHMLSGMLEYLVAQRNKQGPYASS